MRCVRCQHDIADDARYCAACGAHQSPPAEASGTKRLTRSRTNGTIGGVCAGIAEYLSVDATLVRLVWIVLTIMPGMIVGGVLAYLLAWLVMPEETSPARNTQPGARLMRSRSDRKIGGVCGGLAAYLGVDSTPLRLLWVVLSILPGAIAGGIIAYVIAWIVIPNPPLTEWQASPNTANPS